MITNKQRIAFFKLWRRAMSVAGIPEAQSEQQRHDLIQGIDSASGGSLRKLHETGYDALMARVSAMAQDWQEAAYWSGARARRLGAIAEDLVWQIWEIERALAHRRLKSSAISPAEYIGGILKQSKFAQCARLSTLKDGGTWALELTEGQSLALISMLDTHRRRLLREVAKASVILEEENGSEMKRAFSLGDHYTMISGRLIHTHTPIAHEPVRLRRALKLSVVEG